MSKNLTEQDYGNPNLRTLLEAVKCVLSNYKPNGKFYSDQLQKEIDQNKNIKSLGTLAKCIFKAYRDLEEEIQKIEDARNSQAPLNQEKLYLLLRKHVTRLSNFPTMIDYLDDKYRYYKGLLGPLEVIAYGAGLGIDQKNHQYYLGPVGKSEAAILQEEHAKAITKLQEEHTKAIEQLQADHSQAIEQLQADHSQAIAKRDITIVQYKKIIKQHQLTQVEKIAQIKEEVKVELQKTYDRKIEEVEVELQKTYDRKIEEVKVELQKANAEEREKQSTLNQTMLAMLATLSKERSELQQQTIAKSQLIQTPPPQSKETETFDSLDISQIIEGFTTLEHTPIEPIEIVTIKPYMSGVTPNSTPLPLSTEQIFKD